MRLTNQMREETIKKIIEQKIDAKLPSIMQQVEQVAQDAVDHRYPVNVKKWIDAAPERGVTIQSRVFIYIDGKKFDPPLLGIRHTRITVKPHGVIAADSNRYEVEPTSNGKRKLKSITVQLERLDEKKAELKKVLTSALWSVTTLKQLHDNYPDLAKYLPRDESACKSLAVTNEVVVKALKTA